METIKQSKRPSSIRQSRKFEHKWGAQCGKCLKWRLISTKEEYEEIRSKMIEDPFVCNRKTGVSCDDPADIEYDNSRTWVIDKPSIPRTPEGFKRTVVMRNDMSKLDCYYETPCSSRLRAMTDVPKFLDKYPEYKDVVSVSDFSFSVPKIVRDTVPDDLAMED